MGKSGFKSVIGIYGGTFDPVHYGHLRTALEVKDIFGLDEVRLIPCSQPAHRASPLSSAEQRLVMLELAVQNQPSLLVDKRELQREGVSYMVDTLESLRNEMPCAALLLFIGTDAFKGLTAWNQWQRLFDFAHVVVMTRPGYENEALSEFLAAKLTENIELLKQKNGCLFFQAVTQLDISATAIRQMLAANKNPGFLLPDTVLDYIKQHKLYC